MFQPRFIVSALKHRPNTFAEVLAQEHTIQTIKHSIERNRLANGYIFAGSRGTGKTTTARIFAKAINCENRDGAEPCNKCDSCVAVMRGNHPDVIEIDAASNRGVEDIKELRESTRFSPTQSPFKIFIIDESHMLTREANNALLKTLEEPPPHCKFIFATTELHKVPQTILSRCQRFTFRRIPMSVIRQHLLNVIQSQSERDLKPSPDLESILYQIARASEGVLRDALVLLDQVLAFCSEEPKLSEAQDVLGVIEFDRLDAFVGAVIDDDPAMIISSIEEAARMGRDMRLFLLETLRHLRTLAIAKIDTKHPDIEDMPDEERKKIVQRSTNTPLEQLLYITDQLWEAERRLGYAADSRLVLEMSALKAAKVAQAVKIGDLLEKIASAPATGIGNVSPPVPLAKPAPAPVTPAAPANEPPRRQPPPPEGSPPPEPQPAADVAPPEDAPPVAPPEPEPPAPAKPAAQDGLSHASWSTLLSTLEESGNPMLAGMLADSVLEEMTASTLRIALSPAMAYSKKKLETPHFKRQINEYVNQTFGKALKVTYVIGEENNSPESSASANTEAKPHVNSRQLMDAVENDPVFTRLSQEIGGQITMIRPDEPST